MGACSTKIEPDQERTRTEGVPCEQPQSKTKPQQPQPQTQTRTQTQSQTHTAHKSEDEADEQFPFGKTIHNRPGPVMANESQRLNKLLSYDILDTARETLFDDLAMLASRVCGTPMAAISLIDSSRQWFKAEVGLGTDSTSRDAAFCTYTIQGTEVMQVENALQDERFANNELVLGGPKLRYYLGAPILTDDGFALGAICVLDKKPRKGTIEEKKCLQAIARQIVALFEARSKLRELKVAFMQIRLAEASAQEAHDRAMYLAGTGFEHLLLSPAATTAFRAFLKKTRREHYLSFYLDCQDFQHEVGNAFAKNRALFEMIARDPLNSRGEGGGGGGGGTTLEETIEKMDEEQCKLHRQKVLIDACIAALRIYEIYISPHAPHPARVCHATKHHICNHIQPLLQLYEAAKERKKAQLGAVRDSMSHGGGLLNDHNPFALERGSSGIKLPAAMLRPSSFNSSTNGGPPLTPSPPIDEEVDESASAAVAAAAAPPPPPAADAKMDLERLETVRSNDEESNPWASPPLRASSTNIPLMSLFPSNPADTNMVDIGDVAAVFEPDELRTFLEKDRIAHKSGHASLVMDEYLFAEAQREVMDRLKSDDLFIAFQSTEEYKRLKVEAQQTQTRLGDPANHNN